MKDNPICGECQEFNADREHCYQIQQSRSASNRACAIRRRELEWKAKAEKAEAELQALEARIFDMFKAWRLAHENDPRSS